jgi:hypothetical protein
MSQRCAARRGTRIDGVIPFRNPSEILGRLELSAATHALLVGAPPELEAMVQGDGSGEAAERTQSVPAGAIRSVKDHFDFILLWQEDRVGSHAVLDAARKRLLPGGRLWVATAMKKVQGPRVPAAHRLGLEDLRKAFAKDGLSCDREVRLSAWHTAYRFVGPGSEPERGR